MNGTLLVDKPEEWTSFDVVNYVRRMVARLEGKKPRNVKVGHTGTLDPAATGLLVLCVGKATKQVESLMKQDKIYEVELTLGKVSTTEDKEGDITDSEPKIEGWKAPSLSEVQAAVTTFVGEIEQTPPIFSAIKIDGKRAYNLARAGKPVAMKSRVVRVYEISELLYDYPELRFKAHVGSGTYIRSLARDIGEKLGCGAYMSNLRRVSVGCATVAEAYAVSALTDEILQKILV